MYLNCRRGQGNRVLRIRVQNLQPNLPIISSPSHDRRRQEIDLRHIAGLQTSTTAIQQHHFKPFRSASYERTGYYHKTHECSVCDSEFTSVQVLSGHMCRHRRGCGRDSGEIAHRRPKRHRSNLLCLELDLNHPTTEENKRDQSGVVSMAAMDLVSSLKPSIKLETIIPLIFCRKIK